MDFQPGRKFRLCVFVCYFWTTQTAVGIEELNSCTNETSTDCCLCHQKSCDDDVCPASLYLHLVSSSNYSCTMNVNMETTTVHVTPTTDDDVGVSTSDLIRALKPTTKSSESEWLTVCVAQCPDGYFHNEENKNCTKCNLACKTCNASGLEGCIECKVHYNNTCLYACPANTIPVLKNSTCKIDKDVQGGDDDDKDNKRPIIIGASAGGGVAVVVVVVIIICCCRSKRGDDSGVTGTQFRAKSRSRTAMSGIIEEKKESGGKKDKKPNVPRPDYENTAMKDSTLKSTIPDQGDVVLRYTKDPTESVKLNTMKPVVPEPANRDSTYANAAMIKSQKNMSEEQEIAALPLAPALPSGTVEEPKGHPHRKKKLPLSERISKKLSSKHKKKDKNKQLGDEPTEDYIDMSHATPETDRKAENQSEEHDQEDYENAPKKRTKKQPTLGKSQTGTKSVKPQNGSNDELEDYENTPAKLEIQSKGTVNQAFEQQEDYEVMMEGAQGVDEKEKVTGMEAQLEDYENVKELAKGNTNQLAKDGKKMKPLPFPKGGKAVVESKTKVTKSGQPADDNLEDYENTAGFSKLGENEQTLDDTEKPYMNIEMTKGKMKYRKT